MVETSKGLSTPGKRCQLRWSTQHLLEVYSQEFEIPASIPQMCQSPGKQHYRPHGIRRQTLAGKNGRLHSGADKLKFKLNKESSAKSLSHCLLRLRPKLRPPLLSRFDNLCSRCCGISPSPRLISNKNPSLK
jgi:hypothetical protein